MIAAACVAPAEPPPQADPLAELPREDYSFELPDGRILTGTGIRNGDMMLVGGDAVIPMPGKGSASKAHVTSGLWPTKVIVYEFDPAVSAATRQKVLSAMNPWKSLGFIFRQRTTQAAFVRITTEYIQQNGQPVPSWVCAATIGFSPQNFYWAGSSCRTRDFVHEWGHVLGLYHEHARADRGNFITVDPTRITEQIGSGASWGPYDFDSIMHYDAYDRDASGQVDYNHVLIRPLDQRPLSSFGWNDTPSSGDYAALSSLYANRSPGTPLYQTYNYQYQDWFYTIDPSERNIAVQIGYVDFGVAARLEPAQEASTAPFWRFYKGPPQTDHFYTTSADETNWVLSNGWGYERVEGYLYVYQAEGTTPLYRYSHWDPATSDLQHFYTVDASLYVYLIGQGWGYDGVAGYAYAP
jgi:hypothetical protein